MDEVDGRPGAVALQSGHLDALQGVSKGSLCLPRPTRTRTIIPITELAMPDLGRSERAHCLPVRGIENSPGPGSTAAGRFVGGQAKRCSGMRPKQGHEPRRGVARCCSCSPFVRSERRESKDPALALPAFNPPSHCHPERSAQRSRKAWLCSSSHPPNPRAFSLARTSRRQ